jgi:hypothetical protein
VKSVLWRQAEECAVIYTEDRDHLRRLLALDKFPLKREEDAATYRNARGRVFAWQTSFALSLWNRVVRALGRSEIEIRQEAEARGRRAVKPAPASPLPLPAASSHARRRSTTAPSLPPAAAARPEARSKRPASVGATPTAPAKATPASRSVAKTTPAPEPLKPRVRKGSAVVIIEPPPSQARRAKRESQPAASPPVAAGVEAKTARSRRTPAAPTTVAAPTSKAASAKTPKTLPAQPETMSEAPRRGRPGHAEPPVTAQPTKKAVVPSAAGRSATTAPQAGARIAPSTRSQGSPSRGNRAGDMLSPAAKRGGSDGSREPLPKESLRADASMRKTEVPSQKSPPKNNRRPLPMDKRSKGAPPIVATDLKPEGSRRLRPAAAATPVPQAASPARLRSAGQPRGADRVAPQGTGRRLGAAPEPKTPAAPPAASAETAAPTRATGRQRKPVLEEQPELALDLPAPVKPASRAKAAPTTRTAKASPSEPVPRVAPPTPRPRHPAASPSGVVAETRVTRSSR